MSLAYRLTHTQIYANCVSFQTASGKGLVVRTGALAGAAFWPHY